jgi:hypothetical protein
MHGAAEGRVKVKIAGYTFSGFNPVGRLRLSG